MSRPPRLLYCPRLGATLEVERSALAAVYRMILLDDNEAAVLTGGADARKEFENGPDAETILHGQHRI